MNDAQFAEYRKAVTKSFDDRVAGLATTFASIGAHAEADANDLQRELDDIVSNPQDHQHRNLIEVQRLYAHQIKEKLDVAARNYERADNLNESGMLTYSQEDMVDPEFTKRFQDDFIQARNEHRLLRNDDMGLGYELLDNMGEPYEGTDDGDFSDEE